MKLKKIKSAIRPVLGKPVFWIAAALVLAAVCILYVLSGFFTSDEPPLDQVLEEKIHAYETDLRDSLGSIQSNTDMAGYLLTWASNKQIPAAQDAYGNIIYTLPPTQNAVSSARPAAVICSFDADDMESHLDAVTAAMTIAKNTPVHGPLQIVFLAEERSQKTGAAGFDAANFEKNTNVFVLGKTETPRVSSATGGFRHLEITKKIRTSSPRYEKAYRITIKNCPETVMTAELDTSWNPIKTLGALLASFKSDALLFELAEFRGGTDSLHTPSEASMTVVINESDDQAFLNKTEDFISDFYDKYGETISLAEFTFEETELPNHVLSDSDTEKMVSLLYTAFHGIYNRDSQGTVTAVTNIGSISTENRHVNIHAAVMCCDGSLLEEITEIYHTICGLSDMKMNLSASYPVYDAGFREDTLTLLETFRQNCGEFRGSRKPAAVKTAGLTACSMLYEKNRNLNMIFCGMTENTNVTFAFGLVTLLMQTGEQTE